MTLAFLITSHRLPQQVVRLASILRRGSPSSSITIHHDSRSSSLDRAELAALGVDLVDPPSVADWGRFSHLAMVLRCVRWLNERRDFDWLVLISGQDYPIRPVAEIERSLAEASGELDAFIETNPCPRPGLGAPPSEFACRYHYRWRRLPPRVPPALARAASRAVPLALLREMPSGTWLGVPSLRSPFDDELVCHFGSDWFTLSRSAVQAVDDFARRRADVLDYYRGTLIPTESFFQTALANDATLRLSGDHGRYLVFDPPRSTGPRALRLDDVEQMLSSGANFARKFDVTVDARVLDEIDRRVHTS